MYVHWPWHGRLAISLSCTTKLFALLDAFAESSCNWMLLREWSSKSTSLSLLKLTLNVWIMLFPSPLTLSKVLRLAGFDGNIRRKLFSPILLSPSWVLRATISARISREIRSRSTEGAQRGTVVRGTIMIGVGGRVGIKFHGDWPVKLSRVIRDLFIVQWLPDFTYKGTQSLDDACAPTFTVSEAWLNPVYFLNLRKSIK